MDELNQVQDESLFDDIEEPEAEAEETTEAKAEEPFLTVRYDKEDKNLSRDEAVTYAQKGMNYDRMYGKYQELNDRINSLAELNGMSVDEYIDSLNTVQTNYAVSKEVQELKNTYPNAEPELLKELAEKKVAEKFANQRTEKQTEVENREKERNENLARQMDIFARIHPDVKADELDEEVYQLMSQGYTLLEAYTVVYQPKYDAQNNISKKNEANKKKALGNVSTSDNISSDDFLSGFLKG